MSKPNKQLADLYLAGVGLRGLEQITRETQSVLEKCRAIFHYGEPHRELEAIGGTVVDLSNAYWTGEDRTVVYRRLVARVMAEVRRGPGVASITYGHPTLFDDVHMTLVRRCQREGLKCVVLPAVSCLDTVCIDLMIDYGDPGLVVFEATDLVMNRRKMNTELHTLVLQVGAFGIDATTDTISDTSGMFDDLERYLQQYYPRGHKMMVCYSNDGRGSVKFSVKLGEMRRHEHRMFPGTTLYIPPC